MKLLVGLGNPGGRYRSNRHNVGFRVVEDVARRAGVVLDQRRFDGRFARAHWCGTELALLLPGMMWLSSRRRRNR